MLPLAAMLLAQGIPAAINIGKSISQAHKANQLAKTPRPEYQIPKEVIDAVNNAKYIASMRELPGQNLMENKIGNNVSRGIADLKDVSSSPSELAANVAKLYLGSNDNLNDIGIAAGQNWLNNQGQLRAALGQLATYKDKQWDINQFQPYANNMAASSALREGAFRNLSAAGQDIASGLSGYGNMQYQTELLNKYLNANKQNNDKPNTTITQAVATPISRTAMGAMSSGGTNNVYDDAQNADFELPNNNLFNSNPFGNPLDVFAKRLGKGTTRVR